MCKAQYWHSEGYRDEKGSLLTRRKGKKTWLLLGPESMPATICQNLRLSLHNFFLPTIIWGRVIVPILWMRQWGFPEAAGLSPGLWNSEAPIPRDFIIPTSVSKNSSFLCTDHRMGQKIGSISPWHCSHLYLPDTPASVFREAEQRVEEFLYSPVQVIHLTHSLRKCPRLSSENQSPLALSSHYILSALL